MEKIFVKEVVGRGSEKSLLSHAILHCCNKKVMDNIKGSAGKTPEEDARWIEVDFKMNGVPVKLSGFLTELESQLDRMIKEEAGDIVLTKLSDVSVTLDKIEREVESTVKRIVGDRLGIDIAEEEEY